MSSKFGANHTISTSISEILFPPANETEINFALLNIAYIPTGCLFLNSHCFEQSVVFLFLLLICIIFLLYDQNPNLNPSLAVWDPKYTCLI